MNSKFDFVCLDSSDANPELLSEEGIVCSINLPCEANLYQFYDPEYQRLAELMNDDRQAYAERLMSDSRFEQEARRILGKRQKLFSAAEKQGKLSQRYFTYTFSIDNCRLEYRSFKKYSPDIRVVQGENSILTFNSEKIRGLTYQSLCDWLSAVCNNVKVIDGSNISLENVSPFEWAGLVTCLVKSRIKEPIIFSVKLVHAKGL